jgi:hypothetical protein
MRKATLFLVTCLLGVLWLAVAVASSAPPTPATDDFAQARTLVPPLFPPGEYVFAENEGATTEPGEPAAQGIPAGASVWFDWTPETSGDTNISACGETGSGVVGIYTGEAVASLEPVPRLLGSRACEFGFKAIAGVTYRVQVEGRLDPATWTPATVDVEVALRRFLLNDDFDAATDLGDSPNTGASSEWGNLGATKQPGEPNHDGDPGGSSVWYAWTAPASGTVKVDACIATFPPRLGVYTGSDLAALTPIAAGAGEPGAGCNSSIYGPGMVFFQAVAGTRYDIAVDGRGGASGTFDLIVVMDYQTQRALRGEFLPGPIAPAGSPPARPKTGGVRRIIVSRDVDPATRTAVFRLRPSVPGSNFRCRLDHRAYEPCGAKVTYRHLAYGRHAFRAGTTASSTRTAATATFKIARPSRR